MKYLRKFETEEEYNSFKRTPSADLSHFICLVGTNVIYHSEDAPFYIEAIEDIIISSTTMQYYNYSYDSVNYTIGSKDLSVNSGERVFLKIKDSSTGIYYKPIKVQGKYNVGGALNGGSMDNMFKDETDLVSTEDLTIIGGFQGKYMFSGCTNLAKGPRIFSSRTLDKLYAQYMFEECISLKEAPTILMNGYRDGTYIYTILDYMFKGCSSLDRIVELMPSFSGDYSLGWVNGVSSEGTYILRSTQYQRNSTYLPSGWKIKLYDMDTERIFTKFRIGESYYTADDDMTWETWIGTAYNTLGLRINENSIVNDSGVLILGDKIVAPTDLAIRIAGTDYTITPIESEETTTE